MVISGDGMPAPIHPYSFVPSKARAQWGAVSTRPITWLGRSFYLSNPRHPRTSILYLRITLFFAVLPTARHGSIDRDRKTTPPPLTRTSPARYTIPQAVREARRRSPNRYG